MPFRILVAEDDRAIADLIRMTLEIGSYDVVHAADGNEAAEMIAETPPDLALLDIMLPGQDGYALLALLRRREIPALFITAKVGLSDIVFGLRLGAEDYITKPFEPLELLARVDTALRRVKPHTTVYAVRDVTLDTARHTVTKGGHGVGLTPLEYDLLSLLMRNPNLIFTRDQLLNTVWGYDYMGGTRTVDMHIQRLRAKLDFGDVISTVHRIGYKLVSGA